MTNILITTTPTVENRPVREYLGIVSGEAVMDERRLGLVYYGIFRRPLLRYEIGNFDRHSSKLLYFRKPLLKGAYSYYSHSRELLSQGDYSYLVSKIKIKATPYGLERMCKEFWKLKAEFHKAQKQAIREMAEEAAKLGANAVIGVKIDYKNLDFSGYYDRHEKYESNFRMHAESVWVIATGTAVRL